jgi:hypothetical protein
MDKAHRALAIARIGVEFGGSTSTRSAITRPLKSAGTYCPIWPEKMKIVPIRPPASVART